MSLSSKETLESIANWAEWLSAIFGILAAIAVVILVLVNKPLKKFAEREAAEANARALRFESDNLALRTDLEKAKAETAKAQLDLRQYIDQKANPQRRLERDKFLDVLKGKPSAKVTILCKPEDMEAYRFANEISACLATAGWDVIGITPFASGGRGPRQAAIPAEVYQGGAFGTGVTVKCKNARPTDRENSAIEALATALTIGREGGGDLEVKEHPDLPEGFFQIVIGQRK